MQVSEYVKVICCEFSISLYLYFILVYLNLYPMIEKSSQSEAMIPMNCDPIYPFHGAILNLTVGIWPPF